MDNKLSDAIRLDFFSDFNCSERTSNAPARDQEYFPIMVQQKPVFENNPPVVEQADDVPSIFTTQATNSGGFDIGYDQIYTTQDYTMFCSAKPPLN